MSQHNCANCRRKISATRALANGQLCDKCDWAAAAAEFSSDNTPTRPRGDGPLILADGDVLAA